MTVIKRFENELGFTEIQKYEDEGVYAVEMKSEFARIVHFNTYRFKQDAIRSFQFDQYWLTANVKNVQGN